MKKTLLFTLFLITGLLSNAQQTLNLVITNITYPCINDGSMEVVVLNGTPPYTYVWQQNGMILPANSNIISNLSPGWYSVTVTDANQDLGVASIGLHSEVQAVVSVLSHGTCPAANGSVQCNVTGGTPPYNYYWSNGQQFLNQASASSTITNLSTGQYLVTVVDANGCNNTSNPFDSMAYINNAITFNLATSSTPSTCNDGTATVTVNGGIGPFTFFWNTTPVQTTATATGLNGNTYPQVVVTDAGGCTKTSWTTVTYSNQAMQASCAATNTPCGQNTGSLAVTVSNGQPPYTYLWNTGATTSTINNLFAGNYTVTVTDNNGCSNVFQKYVNSFQVLSLNANSTPANCSNNSGSIILNVTGGTPPYNYLWSNGQLTSQVTGLSSGNYGVTVTDNNGCTTGYYIYLPYDPACYSVVSGTVYDDLNNDCIVDPGEPGIPYQIVDLGTGLYSSSNNIGKYSFSSLTGNSYLLSCNPSSLWNVSCPALPIAVTVNPGQTSSGNNFFLTPSSIQNDLQITSSNMAPPRPGFNFPRYYFIRNNGNIILYATVTITHDANETYVSGNGIANYNAATRTITSTPFLITPGQYNIISVMMNIPSSVPIGTILTNSCTVPVANDITPSNNSYSTTVDVVGSYDPNDKQVSPVGQGSQGTINLNDSVLTYTVRFQNTGNYLAEDIVVTDTLDEDLDISSFRFLGSSHTSEWNINGPRVLTVTFNNIMLPDSNSNEAESHGTFMYQIKRKNTPANGTQYTNTAYIYFDFNAPIVTNTTVNTIQITDIKENPNEEISFFPNPFSNNIEILSGSDKCAKVEIYSVDGALQFQAIPLENKISFPDATPGIYIIKTWFGDSVKVGKLIKR